MRKVFARAILAAVCSLAVSQSQATTITVNVPDPAPNAFLFFGSGSASVTYSWVTFSTSSTLSDGNFFNVGSLFSGDPAVLSSQEQSFGVANILVTLPWATTYFDVDYGTFNGSPVTFTASNGATATFGSTGSFYATPDNVFYNGPAITSVLITSPDAVLNIRDVSFNTPEPSTLVMLGSGLLALGGTLRRKLMS